MLYMNKEERQREDQVQNTHHRSQYSKALDHRLRRWLAGGAGFRGLIPTRATDGVLAALREKAPC